MSKLESYVDKSFNVARFYADVEGHNADWFYPLTMHGKSWKFEEEYQRVSLTHCCAFSPWNSSGRSS
jgi:hypothetical protein